MHYRFISSRPELEEACAFINEKKIVAVDLEADAMHSFKEKICLIQIGCGGKAFLIDPFEMRDIDLFLDVLGNPAILKIFHGSDFDIRSLDRDYGARVNHLFDTEIACRFLGVRERGLGALLKENFDVTVDKRFQKVDWSRRPLAEDMIEYSVLDVAYLEDLCQKITNRLEEKERLSWAMEEFDIQASVKYEINHQPPLFRKFKGAGKMDNRTLAVLENLLLLRYEIAKEKDRPMFKVFSNPSLKILAEEKPTRIDKMVDLKALSKKQADMHGEKLKDAIVRALEMAHRDLPSYPKTPRPKKDKKIQKRIKLLKAMREDLSEQLEMESGFLLNNSLIGSIAAQNPLSEDDLMKIEYMRKWQVQAMGNQILETVSRIK